jgi:hypothetical protein
MSVEKFREYAIDGKLAVTITSEIDKDLIDKLITIKPMFISLNYAKGWIGRDIKFLENHTEIEGLDICTNGILDLSVVNSLKSLKTLAIRTCGKGCINFNNLTNLESASVDWGRGFNSVFDMHNIRRMHISSMPKMYAESLSNFKSLEKLSILGSATDKLGCLGDLVDITELSLRRIPNLSDASFLKKLINIRTLFIQSCGGFSNLSVIQDLEKLEIISLDEISQLSGLNSLRKLKSLRSFVITGKTKILEKDTFDSHIFPELGRLYLPRMKEVQIVSGKDPYEHTSLSNDWQPF